MVTLGVWGAVGKSFWSRVAVAVAHCLVSQVDLYSVTTLPIVDSTLSAAKKTSIFLNYLASNHNAGIPPMDESAVWDSSNNDSDWDSSDGSEDSVF